MTASTTADDKSTADELMRRAQQWTRKDLKERWETIKRGKCSPDWLAGKEFEYLVMRAFDIEELEVRWPYHVTYPQKFGIMEQFDGLVYLDGRPFIVESKDLSDSAAIEAVAKLRFRLEGRPPGTMAILFSVSGFSQPTEVFAQFASPLNVILWASGDLDAALGSGSMTEALRKKLKHAIEYGFPLYPYTVPNDPRAGASE